MNGSYNSSSVRFNGLGNANGNYLNRGNGFRFTTKNTYSANAKSLADRLWYFLSKKVGIRISGKDNINTWSTEFDSFLKTKPYKKVSAVLDYYIDSYDPASVDHCYIHLNPDSFISNFAFLEKLCYWNTSPYSEEEVKDVMDKLFQVKWDCRRSKLLIAVSRSIYNIRLFLDVVYNMNLSDNIKREICYMFYSIDDFVIAHFMKFHSKQNVDVRRAIIDFDYLSDLTYKTLVHYGLHYKECEEIADAIRNIMVSREF